MQPELSPLGKTSAYIEHYDPSLLFPIPRQTKRDEIGVPAVLPFFGSDIWNAYELSWLNLKGKPLVALVSFSVPADSPNIIESKSFKLYLNSFNQTRLDGIDELKARLVRDLSAAAGRTVNVRIVLPDAFGREQVAELDGYCIDNLDVEVTHYQPAPALLRTVAAQGMVEETLCSNLLKSNCLVTGQPDWGSVQIRYRGEAIERGGLLQYLISFRQHNEFHEQCVERIFMDVMRQCKPQALTVYARYTRRGGLDINPFRTTFSQAAPANLRTARQ
ncbi:NADPH-dependent 7-cyano-7-deazaguanine reductase QueF [Chitinimonas sp. BJB300]|uniref:NADPH-dependent 7-cyano-7-deazaguanine reductase QueF n=1 Tax=Chitinimonas sp. BJB300 TaxID=1559339 RepID=UPI000C0E2498|nr:NADPH-dependent 7-cyano-7-deazaguanine reductase QueF [Chitinimonas sp. BJB300]PHV11342.1 NADPH-dependent 7-cyano-7-deazaguanine reductase QueF [Chitinimonas sp. BJB300]TSJ87485.1 NADPH-dependent 7-cyano-7-deazaguanine reductase QueF [Chitinimonas sp. BJB300]